MEITKNLDLKSEQSALIDMHSFMNVLNILVSEFYLLDHYLNGNQKIDEIINNLHNFADAIRKPDLISDEIYKADNLRKDILSKLDDVLDATKLNQDIIESRDNIISILDIFAVRTRELLLRFNSPKVWKKHNIFELKNNFLNVFQAIEKNSKGRYRIIYNIAEHEIKDYLVQLDISGIDDVNVFMPPVFQDVMRDLIANARKYTKPGGRITAGFVEHDDKIIFAVEDTGRGISEKDLPNVVDFGYRGENVTEKETKGGGFGLTKAYWVTKNFNGRMWIESELNKGTKIKIEIPKEK